MQGRGASAVASAEARGTQPGAKGGSFNSDGFSSHVSASSTHTDKVVAPESRASNDQGSLQTASASRATELATEASSFPRQGAHDDGNAKQESKAAQQTAARQAAAPRAAAPQVAAPQTAAPQAPPAAHVALAAAPAANAGAVLPAPDIGATGPCGAGKTCSGKGRCVSELGYESCLCETGYAGCLLLTPPHSSSLFLTLPHSSSPLLSHACPDTMLLVKKWVLTHTLAHTLTPCE